MSKGFRRMNPRGTHTSTYQSGVTLMESMVALVILSVGLLGLAGIHVTGMRGNNGAYLRTQAAILVNDLAERMHANPNADANADVEDGDAYLSIPNIACDQPIDTPNCEAVACNSIQMAQYDSYQWVCSVEALLPGAQINVECIDGDTTDGDVCSSGSSHTISVTWTDPMTPNNPNNPTIAMTVLP